MFRNIVVLLEDEVINSNLLDIATNIAKTSDGHISGVYVLPLTKTMFSIPDAVDVGSFRDKAHKVHEEFDSAIKAAGVKGDWNYTEGGNVVAEVARQSLYADLIILSRGDESRSSIVDKVLLAASCPTLLLSPSITSNGSFNRILVAWKSTRESARALHDTLPLLHKAKDITIVIFGEPNNEEKQSLTTYLTAHGINAKIDQQPLSSFPAEHHLLISDIDSSISDRLLAISKEKSCDLIVMGAYGHSRLSEAILSGVTRQISRNSEIPVLMSH